MALQSSQKGKQRQQLEVDDPTECLNRALTKFQDVLTTEEKQKLQTITAVPDAGGVAFFVAQLDAEKAIKTRRSVAPRLCTFLSATQQFAGAVETFISSNPKVAALIWGGIKTAITVASNIASYFDKVTNLLKDIGLVCPTIQQFGQLYHGHTGLQHALCEYYAVVVELCIKLIEVSRRGVALQTISSIWNPFESEFKQFLDTLKSARAQIDDQISLALNQANQETKQLVEFESQESSLFRSSALSFIKKSSQQQEEAKQWQLNRSKRESASLKIKIRQNLSPVDHILPWKRILKQRVHLTAQWIVHEPAFVEWFQCSLKSIIWCAGTMGMGKSVVMSSVVSYLHTTCRKRDFVSHFFCLTENAESLLAKNIIGSITRQILDSLIERSSHEDLLSIHDESQNLDTDETVHFLLSKLPMDGTYFIVLDGLDECQSDQIREVSRALKALVQQEDVMFKIICAGRPELEDNLFKWTKPQQRIVIDEGKLNIDIDRYITATLDDCLEEGLLVLGDPTIVTTIADVLRVGSQGMFLWAGLCIRDLCEQNSDEEILEALNHLPPGLTELFDSKISRIQQGKNYSKAMDLLRYCGVLKRPLTVAEYREILSISIDDTSLDSKRLVNDMNRVVRGCFGLTFIDDEEHTIHYIHQSVKDHLFHTEHRESARFEGKSIDKHIGFLCLTYLNFSNFNAQLIKVDKAIVDPLYFGTSSLSKNPRVHRTARHVLSSWMGHSPGIKFRELEKTASESFGGSRSPGFNTEVRTPNFAFLVYAKENWALHLSDLRTEETKMWSLFSKFMEDDSLSLTRHWKLQTQSSSQGAIAYARNHASVLSWLSDIFCVSGPELAWTMNEKHYALFLYFLNARPLVNPYLPTNYYVAPLINDGSTHKWAEMLLDIPSFRLAWAQALFIVVVDKSLGQRERHEVTLRLLRRMNDVAAREARFALGAALRRALLLNLVQTFILLLKIDKLLYPEDRVINHGTSTFYVDTFPEKLKDKHRGPLLIVCVSSEKNWAMAERILESGANANISDFQTGNTALHLSLRLTASPRLRTTKQPTLIKQLIRHGVDPNLPNKSGETAFHVAIQVSSLSLVKKTHRNRRLELLKCLFAAGAIIDTPDHNGTTVLHTLTKLGRLEAVKAVVSAGANVNLCDKNGNTALHKVVMAFYLDMNSEIAVEIDRLVLMRCLLNAGGKLNLANMDRVTPLHIVLSRQSSQLEHTLIDYLITFSTDSHLDYGSSLLLLEKSLADLAQARCWLAVKFLVERGVYTDIPGEFGKVALHLASECDKLDIVALLVESGSSPKVRDKFSKTPLHYAAAQGFNEVVSCLLKGSDLSQCDQTRRTALMCARDNGHRSTVKLLLPFSTPVDRCEHITGLTLEDWEDWINMG
ncbi:hypothetical protein N7478_011714 [Penicillium angulare]|uniref:uncharacterized protein n=1 Tax=Penicillium angulare TaxID=116970 RepID=UPI002540A8AA|nr:uncharacterized protein N7478_011714 [Penicillium angulare]KAJ5261119.1 hypothetical protein N7478_011714 [Penicillium angulare]